jgi:DNA-binding response OmpR family regulator
MQRLRGKHILVLEDEPLISMMLEEELAEAGATVVSTYNCQGALEAISTQGFAAATLDLRIGDGDCREVAELLHQQAVPFIVTSGDNLAPDFGAAARLVKPFGPGQLVNALLSVLQPVPGA